MKNLDNSTFDPMDLYRAIELAPTRDIFEEIDYRAQVISHETIHSEDSDSIVSFEKINARKLFTLLRYLEFKKDLYNYEDFTEGISTDLTDEDHDWIDKAYGRLHSIANNIDAKRTFATPEYLYVHKKYAKITYDKEDEDVPSSVGRLYAHDSIINLPREVRYYLFNGEYLDYDMVNSHPTLAYSYSRQHNLECNALTEYVSKRDDILTKVKIELTESKIEYSTAKHHILRQMNRTWEENSSGSKTLDKLDADFTLIREHIWSTYCEGKLAKYKPVVELKHYSKEKLKKKNIKTEADKLRLRKAVLVHFYFSNMETRHLKNLKKFLRIRYEAHLKARNIEKLRDLIPITDKTVEKIDAINTLYTIPFYDGLYVSSECKAFQEQLPDLISLYNKTYSIDVRFAQKEITPEIDKIILRNLSEYKKFEIITSWLSAPANTQYVYKLLRITGAHDCLNELNVKSFDQLKAVFTEIRLVQYLYLLNKDFTTDGEISDIIQDAYLIWKKEKESTQTPYNVKKRK